MLGSLRSTSYKILVPHTQLAIKWFTQMTKTIKTLFFLSSTIHPQGSLGKKSWARAPGAEGIARVGKLKLTFYGVFLGVVCEVFVAV